MRSATLEMIRTALTVDESISPPERTMIIGFLKAGGSVPERPKSLKKLKIRQAAELLQVKPDTISKYLNKGILRGIKPSERWTGVWEESVLALIEDRKGVAG